MPGAVTACPAHGRRRRRPLRSGSMSGMPPRRRPASVPAAEPGSGPHRGGPGRRRGGARAARRRDLLDCEVTGEPCPTTLLAIDPIAAPIAPDRRGLRTARDAALALGRPPSRPRARSAAPSSLRDPHRRARLARSGARVAAERPPGSGLDRPPGAPGRRIRGAAGRARRPLRDPHAPRTPPASSAR